MTKGYPNFEWRLGIPTTEKYDKTQNEDNEIASNMAMRKMMTSLKMGKREIYQRRDI